MKGALSREEELRKRALVKRMFLKWQKNWSTERRTEDQGSERIPDTYFSWWLLVTLR